MLDRFALDFNAGSELSCLPTSLPTIFDAVPPEVPGRPVSRRALLRSHSDLANEEAFLLRRGTEAGDTLIDIASPSALASRYNSILDRELSFASLIIVSSGNYLLIMQSHGFETPCFEGVENYAPRQGCGDQGRTARRKEGKRDPCSGQESADNTEIY